MLLFITLLLLVIAVLTVWPKDIFMRKKVSPPIDGFVVGASYKLLIVSKGVTLEGVLT